MDHEFLHALMTLQRKIKESESSIKNLQEESSTFSNIMKKEVHRYRTVIEKLQHEIKDLKKALHNSEKEKDVSTCVLCFTHQRNVLFRPCNHLVICDNCSGETNFTECIICKSVIESYEYAYL